MLIAPPEASRDLRAVSMSADLAIVGGGVAGCCCAITAARLGLKVVLVQDRPVPGGNASSEVRLWMLGATNHLTTNHRWSREGGVINELLVENLWRNPEGNPVILDALLLEMLVREPNLHLLLNTAVHACVKDPFQPDRIAAVEAFCAQNGTRYRIEAPLFVDASGDGVLGFMAGAAFRMGAESREEFGEAFARGEEFGHLLGHSLYFYSKDTGRPVTFVPPSFALRDVPDKIPRHRSFSAQEHGCRLWWIEYGGRLDTVHDTEAIKWELWKVVYGVWDYIKNSGRFPEAANATLEWVGLIPGKRESRRFEGDYILHQQDVIERRQHPDAVAFGGWSIDLHPADGVYSPLAGSHHLHSKGIYGIPYRCYYSRNISNLFLAGRIVSASHVAFGSTRVMCTTAHGGQAVGVAAALCREGSLLPRDVGRGLWMERLQRGLLRLGQHLPGLPLRDPDDLAQEATISATSEFVLGGLEPGGEPWPLREAAAQLLPLPAGPVPRFRVTIDAKEATTLGAELRRPGDDRHFTPDETLASVSVRVDPGERQDVVLEFPPLALDRPSYVFLILREAPGVSWHTSDQRLTGLVSATYFRNEDYRDVGGEHFDVFRPLRRPGGRNFAWNVEPALRAFPPSAVRNGWQRPTNAANAWVAAADDPRPRLTLVWSALRNVRHVVLSFDVDYDHPMESVLRGHPERAVPFCVRHFRVWAGETLLAEERDHHQARWERVFPEAVATSELSIEVVATHGAPAALFEVRVYEQTTLL